MEVDLGDQADDLLEYPNVPPLIGMAVSTGKATMAELATVLSVEDLHNIIEIVRVDAHNRRIIEKRKSDD